MEKNDTLRIATIDDVVFFVKVIILRRKAVLTELVWRG